MLVFNLCELLMMELRKYFTQRDTSIWPHRDLYSAFLGNHMYKSRGKLAYELEPQVKKSYNYCELKGRPQLIRLNSSGEATSEDEGMADCTPLNMLPGFSRGAINSRKSEDRVSSRPNTGRKGVKRFMPMQNMYPKKGNVHYQWGSPNSWYPATDSSGPNPGPGWCTGPMQMGIQQPFLTALTVPYTNYGFPLVNHAVPSMPVFSNVIPNLYYEYYGHPPAMLFEQGRNRTQSQGPIPFPGAKVREFCPNTARQKKHSQCRHQLKKAPNRAQNCFKSDLSKATDMLTNMTIETPVGMHTNISTAGKGPNQSAVISAVQTAEEYKRTEKPAFQDAPSQHVKHATVKEVFDLATNNCLTADKDHRETAENQCEKQDNAIQETILHSADISTCHIDAMKPQDMALSCTDQHINASAQICHADRNAMCHTKQNNMCSSKHGTSKVADASATLPSDMGGRTGKETTLRGSIELSTSSKDGLNGKACVDSKQSFRCKIQECVNGFCFHIGMRDCEKGRTEKTAAQQTPQQGSCKKKKKSRPSAKKRRRQKNQRTESMYHVQVTNCNNFKSIPKKLKVSHVTDEEVPKTPPTREDCDSDNFDTVSFILNFEQDGHDVDETDNSDILGHAKFSFIIGASSSESDFSDTDFDNNVEEDFNDDTQELLKCFQYHNDPYNPLSFSFLCRKSPAVTIPSQTAIPKSASEPVLSPTDKLKMVNDVWQKNMCEQSPHTKTEKNSPKKVSFAKDGNLARVHLMYAWAYAYAAARKGPWEEYARDRDRFEKRIKDVEKSISYCFDAAHRERVYSQYIKD